MRYILIALCGLLFSTAATAGLSLPSPFQSHYKVFRNGSVVGVGQRIFYAGSDNRLYFCSESHLKWLFLSDHRKEQSWLSFKEDRVMPLEYQFDRTGTGPNRSSHLMFDLKQKTIQELKDDYPLQAGWEEDLLDPVGYQLQMRMDVAAGKK